METITIKLPSIDQIEFELIAEYETTPIEGNALASGDDETDRKQEQMIKRQLRNGNVWAWASVELKGKYKGLEVSDYLGCCSYKSEKDFKKDGYYDDMKSEVYRMIIEKLKSLEA